MLMSLDVLCEAFQIGFVFKRFHDQETEKCFQHQGKEIGPCHSAAASGNLGALNRSKGMDDQRCRYQIV
jgi:hypothetical protein